mmetsp:Transcript_1278/g.4266  ORF Transcript_1278/g.4266 Transcript_1278/m.4266 type:complete len:207 (+) Transcript_1278:368-988(+)
MLSMLTALATACRRMSPRRSASFSYCACSRLLATSLPACLVPNSRLESVSCTLRRSATFFFSLAMNSNRLSVNRKPSRLFTVNTCFISRPYTGTWVVSQLRKCCMATRWGGMVPAASCSSTHAHSSGSVVLRSTSTGPSTGIPLAGPTPGLMLLTEGHAPASPRSTPPQSNAVMSLRGLRTNVTQSLPRTSECSTMRCRLKSGSAT